MKKKKEKAPVFKLMKQLIINGTIFFGLIFFTFWFIFKDQDLNLVFKTIGNAILPFLLIGVCLMMTYFTLEAINIYRLMKSFGEKITKRQALKYVFVNFFFCSVTPSATGGQPLEIYYMTKDGISGAHATISVLLMTAGIEFAVVFLGIVGGIIGNDKISGPMALLYTYGVVVNIIALVVMLLCVFWTRGVKGFLRNLFGLLHKIGIKKALDWRESAEKGIEKYAEGSKYIRTHMKEFRFTMIRGVLQMTAFYLIPYAVYLALGLSGHTIFDFFILQSILFVSTSGIPLPGAIGASESVFLGLYMTVFPEEVLSSAMLLNRGINFYLFVIVSMIVVLINIALLKRRKTNKSA
jgi:hypothetical protein